jgi:hypothetical protein
MNFHYLFTKRFWYGYKSLWFYTTCVWSPNPGPNLTAMLTLGGFGLLALSALIQQLGFGSIDPVVLEIGKAAFYTGIGRAFTQAEAEAKKVV